MKQLTFFFLTLLLSLPAWSEEVPSQASDKLVGILSKINTFSGSFVQYSVDQKGVRIQESKGELKADRSGLFYWHTSEPLEQTVVSDGTTVTVYDPDLDQATVQAIGVQAQTTPAILFSGDTAKVTENFNIEIKLESGSIVQFALSPKTQDSLFERLLVRFDGNQLQELRILDGLGQESTMSFAYTEINPSFPPDTFKLDLPEGTDIIRDLPLQ